MRTSTLAQIGLVLGISCGTLGCSGATGEPDSNDEPTGVHAQAADGTRDYLVIAKDALPSDLSLVVAAEGGAVVSAMPQISTAVVNGTSDFARNMRKVSGILAVVPDIPLNVHAASVLPDPPFAVGENDFLYNMQWSHAAIDTPVAWDSGASGSGVRVAVLDAGISTFHPDVTPNLNTALSASFIPGQDPFVRPAPFPSHGTAVAAVIAAADNGIGLIGVAPEAELVSVKVLSEFDNQGTVASLTAGLLYAADIQADVANMSLYDTWNRNGMTLPDGTVLSAQDVHEMTEPIKRALKYAHDAGVTLVGLTGNDGRNMDEAEDGTIVIPLELSPHVIGVAMTGPNGWGKDPYTNLDRFTPFNNYGTSVVELTAPGGNLDFGLLASQEICSRVVTAPCFLFDFIFTATSNAYGFQIGTSFATPQVSGIAALIIEQNGGTMSPQEVFNVLRTTSDDLGEPGKDAQYGFGRVNAARAVGAQ